MKQVFLIAVLFCVFSVNVCAGLMDKEIGPKLAKQFLDSHEANDGKSASSVMDLNNNAKGLAAADKMIKDATFSADNLEKEASIG